MRGTGLVAFTDETGSFRLDGVPRAIVDRIRSDVARFMRDADFREKLASVGAEPSSSTPEELRDEIRITVLHEIAHHFGIDDERLDELGYG